MMGMDIKDFHRRKNMTEINRGLRVRSGDGIPSRAAPGMTSQDAAECQQRASCDAVAGDCLGGILAAGRSEAAGGRK